MKNIAPMTFHRKYALTLLLAIASLIAWPAMAEEETEERGVTDYIAMEPAFVTHVGEPGNKVIYLKASVTLRASQETTRAAVQAHMPRLRHELVMLFGEQTDVDQLTTQQGQQALRGEAEQRINTALEEQKTGERITGVLFTEFVVQR